VKTTATGAGRKGGHYKGGRPDHKGKKKESSSMGLQSGGKIVIKEAKYLQGGAKNQRRPESIHVRETVGTTGGPTKAAGSATARGSRRKRKLRKKGGQVSKLSGVDGRNPTPTHHDVPSPCDKRQVQMDGGKRRQEGEAPLGTLVAHTQPRLNRYSLSKHFRGEEERTLKVES